MLNRMALYKQFKELHHQSKTLILPNAWDVNSAKLFEWAGFEAIGTTSAGIAASLGYEDGEKIPFNKLMEIEKNMIDSVSVPITVDIETGYGSDEQTLIENIHHAISIGAVGINIEDGFEYDSTQADIAFKMVDRIKKIKEFSQTTGNPIFVNARIDIYWLKAYPEELRLEKTIKKANAYFDAGADCVFVPAIDDMRVMSDIVRRVKGPINFLLGKGTPNLDMLSQLGVARLSVGSAPFRKITSVLKEISVELRDGVYDTLLHNTISYSDMFNHLHPLNKER